MNLSSITRLLRDVFRLIASWWQVDRVRVSPHEGRLLRLEPPCVMVVESRPAEVLARTVGRTAAGPFVVYDCRSATGPCQLRVVPLGEGYVSRVSWIEDGRERELAADDVEVFQGRRSIAHSTGSAPSTLETHRTTQYG
jgi:hypothetical protein